MHGRLGQSFPLRGSPIWLWTGTLMDGGVRDPACIQMMYTVPGGQWILEAMPR